MKRFVYTFAAVVNLVLADQIAKSAAIAFLKGKAAIALAPFFNLAYVENRGCAWGLFQGRVWPLAAFGIAAFAVLVWKRKSVFPKGVTGTVAELLLYAGIVGNLIDRIARGCVVDFLDFHWGVHHFPCFNVADSYITVAAGLLILAGLLESRRAARP